MSLLARSGRSSRMIRQVRPSMDGLEPRLLMYATTGNKFSYGSLIRFSIMPDGTDLGNGSKSNLYAVMDQKYGNRSWQTAILDAAAWWESYANVNMAYVYDNGSAVGSGSYQQGTGNFGDIRVGGFFQDSNSMGYTLAPPTAIGDSSSSDIFLNTALNWTTGSNAQGTFDLESVVLHEMGHSLGLAHSTDPKAIMFATYQGTRPSLNYDDVKGIQAMWGTRVEDAIAQRSSNDSFWSPADITSYTNQYNQIILPAMNVTDSNRNYWFKVVTPSNASSTFAAVVQTSNLSLMSPLVQIYNTNGNLLAQNSASPTTYGTIVGTQIGNATPNTTYIIKVTGSNDGVTGVGAYALFVNMGSGNLGPVPPPYTLVANQPNKGGGVMYQTIEPKNQSQGHTKKQHADNDVVKLGNLIVPGDTYEVSPKLAQNRHRQTVQVGKSHPVQRLFSRHTVLSKNHREMTSA